MKGRRLEGRREGLQASFKKDFKGGGLEGRLEGA